MNNLKQKTQETYLLNSFLEHYGTFGFASRILISPFTVIRIACLSTKHLTFKNRSEIIDIIAEFEQAKDVVRSLKTVVTNEIHELIPNILDNSLRRKVLKFKRDVHNDRLPKIDAELNQWFHQVVESNTGDTTYIIHFLEKMEIVRSIPDLLRSAIEAAKMDVRLLMLDVSQNNEVFRKGLALSAPNLISKLKDNWIELPHGKRKYIERTVFAYMTRATSKTSPFSTLTVSAVMPLVHEYEHTSCDTKNYSLQLETHLNRSIPTAIRVALIQQSQVGNVPFDLIGNPHVNLKDNYQIDGFFRRYEVRKGSYWAEQFFSSTKVGAELYDAITRVYDRSSDINSALGYFDRVGDTDKDKQKLIQKLARRDIFRFSGDWGPHCRYPALRLAEKIIPRKSNNKVALAKDVLVKIHRHARDFSFETAEKRPQGLQVIQELCSSVLDEFGDVSYQDIRNPVLEDAWADGLDFKMGSGFRDRLDKLASVVASKLQVSPEYLWLRDQFITVYGRGGSCKDVGTFIKQGWQQFSAYMASNNDPEKHEYGHFGDINENYLHVPLTLYFQCVGKEPEDLDDSNTPIVLNGAYNRIGWQIARSTASGSQRAAKHSKLLSEWLIDANAPKLPVTTSVSGESSNLQSHARICEKSLVLDGHIESEQDIQLDDLVLRHDLDSNMLHFHTKDGQEISINYLGSAVPMVPWGPRYLLLVLAEPLQIGRPAKHDLFAEESDPEFRHQLRVEEDNCVLIRETWWLKVSLFAKIFEEKDLANTLLQISTLWRKYDLPESFFISGQPSDLNDFRLNSVEKHRKPVWIDIFNPFCVEQLLRIARDVDWLVIREALPSPNDSWMEKDHERYVSEFMIEMVLTGKSAI